MDVRTGRYLLSSLEAGLGAAILGAHRVYIASIVCLLTLMFDLLCQSRGSGMWTCSWRK